jgi:uncharacterized protein YoxC
VTEPFNLTLNVAQLVLLGGLIWGLAKMSASVDSLRKVTQDLTAGLERIGAALASLITRVTVLEDRTARNVDDRRRL